MRASMDYSDQFSGESQATQLLQSALDGAGDTSSDPKITTGQIDDINVSRDLSSDSHTSSTRNSTIAPRYHYHGLATTQSEHEDSAETAGSQKENINAPIVSGELKQASGAPTHLRPPSPYASSSKNLVRPPPSYRDRSGHPPSCDTTAKSKPATLKTASSRATATSGAPHPTTAVASMKTHVPPPRPRTRLRIVRSSSQDSFGGAVSQDLERQFLAESKQFEVPLSELGRVSTQDTSLEPACGTEQASMTRSSILAHPVSGRDPGHTLNHGNVLVAATPSNSGSSQSQSQPSQPSQDFFAISNRQPLDTSFDHDINIDVDGDHSQASTQVTQPSSSYERLLAGEEDMSTQIVDNYQATQPATQPNESADVYQDVVVAQHNVAAYTGTNSSVPPSNENIWVVPLVPASASTTSTAPRSLRRMVNPQKLWRLQNLTGRDGVGSADRGAERMQPVLEETQISYDPPTPSSPIARNAAYSTTGPSRASGPSDNHPGRDLLNPKHIRSEDASFPRRRPLQVPLTNDSNDVVPDSEPPISDQDPSTSTPIRSPLHMANEQTASTKNPVKRPFREIDPSSEPEAGSGEIVPDSVLIEEEEEEEDVPLAAVNTKRGPAMGNDARKSKEKGRDAPPSGHVSAAMAPPASVLKGKQKIVLPAPVGRVKQTKAPKSTSRTGPHLAADAMLDHRQNAAGAKISSEEITHIPGRSWETGVVPSSAPEQDGNSAAVHESRKTETSKGKGKAANKANTATTGRRTRTTFKRRRLASDTEDDVEVSDEVVDETLLIPKVEKEEEEETEPADEDYMDVDFKDNDSVAGSSRKTKRGSANAKAGSRPLRNPPRTTKSGRTLTATPSAKQGKRLRSVTSASASRGATESATRVFALWKQDGHYYSGTVYSRRLGTKYLIKFDDDTEDVVDITRLRRCELAEGDDIILADGSQKARVVDVTRCDSNGVVGVEADDGAGIAVFDVEMSDLRIATRTVTRQWANRTLTTEGITTVVKPKPLKSPSPSKISVLSGNSIKGAHGKPFSKTGLVVTLSVGNENWERDKDTLMNAIKEHGGTVIDDWSNIFKMDGKHSHNNKRWVVYQEEVEWTGREDMERVFLLADDANSKPKYLIALALGIPCLSVNWLYDSLTEGEKDWQAYLLPQGFSEPLDARVSQFVDLDWCNSFDHLNDIMSNRVPSKLFSEKSVLCLGTDFVPLPRNKKNISDSEKSKEASRMVPRIILAMGATRVEAVTDLKFVSDNISTFDYVVIKESGFVPALKGAAMCVHLPWVKDCLIAGRLLPLPEW